MIGPGTAECVWADSTKPMCRDFRPTDTPLSTLRRWTPAAATSFAILAAPKDTVTFITIGRALGIEATRTDSQVNTSLRCVALVNWLPVMSCSRMMTGEITAAAALIAAWHAPPFRTH